MEEEGGELIIEEKEVVFLEENVIIVLQMLLVEFKIRTPVIQVVTGLINKKFNVIIVRNLVSMHMNAGSTGDSLVDQYPITLVHIVGFKIIKN